MKLDVGELQGKLLYTYLVEHKSELLAFKKQATKYADVVSVPPISKEKLAANKVAILSEDNLADGILKRTIVANTYLWMDSHDDVHIPGIFAKSIAERGAKNLIPHLHDHVFEIGAKVGEPLSFKEADISWKELGVDQMGDTMALLMDTQIEKNLNKLIYKQYLANKINQHSVWMRYVKLDLAINDEDYADEFKTWKAYIDKLGNKEDVVKQGYFFAVKEAILIEVSCVLAGSNELTPVLGGTKSPKGVEDKKKEPVSTLTSADLLKHYKLN